MGNFDFLKEEFSEFYYDCMDFEDLISKHQYKRAIKEGRLIGEEFTKDICERNKMNFLADKSWNQISRIKKLKDEGKITGNLKRKLWEVQKIGNESIHDSTAGRPKDALRMNKLLYDIARSYYLEYTQKEDPNQIPEFKKVEDFDEIKAEAAKFGKIIKILQEQNYTSLTEIHPNGTTQFSEKYTERTDKKIDSEYETENKYQNQTFDQTEIPNDYFDEVSDFYNEQNITLYDKINGDIKLSVPGISFTAPEGYKIVTVNDWQYGGEILPGYLVYNNFDEVCLFIRYIPPQYATVNSMANLRRYIISTKYTIYENIQLGNADGFKAEYVENLFKGDKMAFLYVDGFNYGYKIRYDDDKYLSLLKNAVFSKTEINVTVTRTDENLIYSSTDAQIIETPYFSLKAPKHWKLTEKTILPNIRYELISEKFLSPLYILVQQVDHLIPELDGENLKNPIFVNKIYQGMLTGFNAYDIRNYNIAGVEGKLFKTDTDGNIIILIKGKFSFLCQYSDEESLSVLNSIQLSSKNNDYAEFKENAIKKREGSIFCPNCGAENSNYSKFCPKCGIQLTGKIGVNNQESDDVNDYLKELYDDGILEYYEYEASKKSIQYSEIFKELIELVDTNAITDDEFKKLYLYIFKTGNKSLINKIHSVYNFYQSGSISRGQYSSIKKKVLNKCDEVINQASQLTKDNKEHSSIMEDMRPELSKGIFLQVYGDFEGSLEALNKVLKIEPDNMDALDAKGWDLVCLGRWQEALDVSNEVLAVEPLRDSSLDNKGCSLMHLGRWDEAIEPLQKAIKVNPLNEYAWNNLGQTYMHFKWYDEAINCFNKVFEINPEHSDAKKFKQECLKKI